MNPIFYIAIAIPLVGFLTRHLLASRDQYNEAIRAGTPSPTNRALVINGAVFIAIAILTAIFLTEKASIWPVIIIVLMFLAEGIWDLCHGLLLVHVCRQQANSTKLNNEKPEQGVAGYPPQGVGSPER